MFYVDTGKSGDETAETCALKALQIRHDGEIIGNGGANGKVRHNSCQRWQWGGSASCNSTWSVNIPPLTGGGGGNIYQIKAYFSHHSLSYGAYLVGVYGAYAGHTGLQIDNDENLYHITFNTYQDEANSVLWLQNTYGDENDILYLDLSKETKLAYITD